MSFNRGLQKKYGNRIYNKHKIETNYDWFYHNLRENVLFQKYFRGKKQKINILNVRSPTEKTTIDIKSKFYETLEKKIWSNMVRFKTEAIPLLEYQWANVT